MDAINCPNCGTPIAVAEALAAQLRARFAAEHDARLKQAVAEAEHRAQEALSGQLTALRRQLAAQADAVRDAEARELELRRRALENRPGANRARGEGPGRGRGAVAA